MGLICHFLGHVINTSVAGLQQKPCGLQGKVHSIHTSLQALGEDGQVTGRIWFYLCFKISGTHLSLQV